MSSLITITGSGRADQLAKVCCELRSPLTLTTNVDPFFQVYVPPNPSPTPPFRRNCAHLVRGHGIRARGRRHGRHGHQRAHSHVDPQFLAWNHRPLSNFRIFSSISEPFFPSFHFFVGIAGLSFAQPPDFRFSRDIANNLLFLFRSPTHFSHKRRHKNLATTTTSSILSLVFSFPKETNWLSMARCEPVGKERKPFITTFCKASFCSFLCYSGLQLKSSRLLPFCGTANFFTFCVNVS